ncbi:hypothetical protein M1247_34270 [Mycobacterium sp. 21AC1]|uniref:hypothetical protein n=1 Tax=[Mycobacterium] appelbergii TaxID=2939269 RepID=UPI0029393EC7|nr:hypothetical protein [Mycobacterium sp. 21AC1]MDV3130012.1 hypothetical protein [Mycobacterium sp. 21AC1]
MTDQPDEIPNGFAIPVTYNDIDGVEATRTDAGADYVAPAIYSKEQLRRLREERDDD